MQRSGEALEWRLFSLRNFGISKKKKIWVISLNGRKNNNSSFIFVHSKCQGPELFLSLPSLSHPPFLSLLFLILLFSLNEKSPSTDYRLVSGEMPLLNLPPLFRVFSKVISNFRNLCTCVCVGMYRSRCGMTLICVTVAEYIIGGSWLTFENLSITWHVNQVFLVLLFWHA